ncbi:lysosomal Pro-X carboxypeptidase isoform X2 [Dermacentor silvarum]|uniref:lysosomal Pro-X carboxypeptidase isoform X2 n=1 Tax=Dermacentor silvarum TaxID=543639 RepID=UPI002100F8A2|nr:lysosomal Pro-X carboxypeptidase isoform X2 [Dermacentor silvarum]
MADQYWNRKGGPIFIYTTNEGSIEDHISSTGLMWEWARDFKALLVFPEHRYYGRSLPFGKDSFKAAEMTAYLTTEQALADYVDLVMWLKKNIKGAGNSRVAAFGGHHAAMLATWFRIKYPHTVSAALASSAPFKMFSQTTKCDTYYKAVTAIYKQTSKLCPNQVKRLWPILDGLGSTDDGRHKLGQKFHLCQRLSSSHFPAFRNWIRDSLIGVALVNYPYRSGQVPPHPVKVLCNRLRKSERNNSRLIDMAVEAIGFFRNATGKAACYAVPATPDNSAWLFQQCTEFALPLCGDGIVDMFYPAEWDNDKFDHKCRLLFGVKPKSTDSSGQWEGPTCAARRKFSSPTEIWTHGQLTESKRHRLGPPTTVPSEAVPTASTCGSPMTAGTRTHSG